MFTQPSILIPGTVLLDHYVDTQTDHLGGAEFNFAFHMHAFGMRLDFIARIGDDAAGANILSQLRQLNFPVQHIQIDNQRPSKIVTVKRTEKNEPIFIIPSNVASEYLEFPSLLSNPVPDYALVYFGTTLQHAEKSRATLHTLLAQSEGICFCDINLRPNKYTFDTVMYSLHTCTVLKLNHEELAIISDMIALRGTFENQLHQLSQRFHIKTICLTLAEKGCLLYHAQTFFSGPAIAESVCDTVGAGDAFSACLALGLLLQWSPQRIISNASAFAGAICGIRGALPTHSDFYSTWCQHFFQQCDPK